MSLTNPGKPLARAVTAVVAATTLLVSGCGALATEDSVAGGQPPPKPNGPTSPPVAEPAPPEGKQRPAAGKPKSRPGPDRSDVERRRGKPVDERDFVALANDLDAVAAEDGGKIGKQPGRSFVLYGYGDVLNYQSSQRLTEADADVIRVVRAVRQGGEPVFYIVTFDAASGGLLLNERVTEASVSEMYEDRPDTPWRD